MDDGERSEQELYELLRAADEAEHSERPPNFDERRARDKFVGLVQALVGAFGAPVQYEAGFPLIQDASFFGQLTIPAETIRSGIGITVRTSNFADLATIVVEDPDLWDEASALRALVDENDLRKVEDLIEEAGYEYIPLALLRCEYDGINEGLKVGTDGRRRNWWDRYFDWL
jgi:hypothetical protein